MIVARRENEIGLYWSQCGKALGGWSWPNVPKLPFLRGRGVTKHYQSWTAFGRLEGIGLSEIALTRIAWECRPVGRLAAKPTNALATGCRPLPFTHQLQSRLYRRLNGCSHGEVSKTLPSQSSERKS
jgi:hypothetical protein